MSVTQRSNRFRGTGRILSIQPSSGIPMTEFESYQIQSEGLPASEIHSVNPILKPGTSTALDTNAVFFEPTETYRDNSDAPIYSQLVINTDNSDFSTPRKVSEYDDKFPITRPGVMSSVVTSSSKSTAGRTIATTGSIGPRPLSQPQTYRRKGLVEVYLSTASDPDSEVAYSNNGVSWCSMIITDSYVSPEASSVSTKSQYKSFNNFLVGAGATNLVTAFGIGNSSISYLSESRSDAQGATTYNTNGIYRSEVKPFLRDTSGVQYYLKTNVSFETASVTSSATLDGTLTGSWNSVTYEQGYNEFEDGDDPVYTASPDTDRYLVSFKVDGVDQAISDHSADKQYTFNDISGNKSIAVEFGYKLDATVTSGTKKIRIGSTTITTSDGTTSFYFTDGSQVLVEFLDASDNLVDTTTLSVNGVTETNASSFVFDGFKSNQTIAIT